MATLRSYICGKKKTIPRGAASRVAEFLKVNHHRAVQLIAGVAAPDEKTARRIQDFIASRMPFSAFQTGFPARKVKKSRRHSVDTNQALTKIR